MLFIHVQIFTSRASNKAWSLHFCLFCKLGLLYINDKFYKFELINNLSCFVITRTHVIHTNETNTLKLYKRYKKEINNLIDGTLLLSFLIPLIMYIESLLLMVIVLIIPFNVFFFFDFANRKTSSMQMMIFTMMWSQLPLVVIMQR